MTAPMLQGLRVHGRITSSHPMSHRPPASFRPEISFGTGLRTVTSKTFKSKTESQVDE